MTAAAYINGSYRCYSLTNGTARHFLGCAHERPRQAIAHVTPSYVSPLRSSVPDDGPTSPAPLRGAELGPSSGVEGRSNR